MSFFEQVGRNILQLLDENGKTQAWLAEQLQVSRQVVQKIVKGKKAINAMEIARIAEIFHVPMERLTSHFQKPEDAVIQFMGKIENDEVRKQFEFLNDVIDEIVNMEDDLRELHGRQ